MIFQHIRKLFGSEEDVPPAPSKGDSDFLRQGAAHIAAFLAKNKEDGVTYWCEPRNSEVGKMILALPREEQTYIVEAAVRKMVDLDRKAGQFKVRFKNPHAEKAWGELWYPRQQLNALIESILKKKLPFTSDQAALLAGWVAKQENFYVGYYPVRGIVSVMETLEEPINQTLEAHLRTMLGKLQADQRDQGVRKVIQRLQQILGDGHRMPVQRGEVWSNAVVDDVEALPAEIQTAWIELFEHCAQASGAKPSGKWSKQARQLIQKRIGTESFREKVLAWFPLVDKPRPPEMTPIGAALGRAYTLPPSFICDVHGDILRGLAWACESVAGVDINRALTALALSSYKKIPGTGPRLTKVGNACIATLGVVGGLDAIGQLAVLKVKVKFGTAQAMLEKALNAAAEKEGLPRQELEEMSVPAYGLTEVGSATVLLGETTAEIHIDDSRSVSLHWKNAQGKLLKAPPTAVKNDFAEDLKELRQTQKDIERMLIAQSERLDQLFLAQKTWPLTTWRERYLDHPLMGVLTRRLIWKFENGGLVSPAMWNAGRLETADGQPAVLTDDTIVSLWHPLDSSTAEVQVWRERTEALQIRQPFKQAHREVYVLTPAEENTGVYSNRFASHVLKQHQFNALCGQRGWKNQLRLMVDSDYNPAQCLLPGWNLRAEFWIEGLGSDYGTDTNDTGTYLYLSTDQVRFYAIDVEGRTAHAGGGGYQHSPWRGVEGGPTNLREIPALVFSEIMRDVDLFVGVCSVGNDPTWADGGPQGRFREYWSNYSFGELSGSAATRKEILERLVPRLKIAGKCSLSDRFLVVQGTMRAYKIHLGSGNILMSPDDRYLCIVARQSVGKAEKEVFLPFEGDQTLSVILSKAFLLANDSAITDPTIVQQIKR